MKVELSKEKIFKMGAMKGKMQLRPAQSDDVGKIVKLAT